MEEIPMLSADLIKQLDNNEPELDVRPGTNIDVIMFRSGRLSLIRELKIRANYTSKKIQTITF